MRRRAGLLAAALLALWLPVQALAQPAALVADNVEFDGFRVIAEGNVQITYEGRVLHASRVIYDDTGENLTIEGPITLVDGADTIVLASDAELDRDLRNGILSGARLVLDRHLQLAANQAARVDGRYTLLTQAVASACQICLTNPTPLWEIRAAEVIHDTQERQLYFKHAQIRVAGFPIFYSPRLRLPDPSVRRATGFLLPQGRTSSVLGFGLKLPYFIVLGDHADVLLTPYVSSQTRTIEGRYRQNFPTGEVVVEGAASDDDLMTDGLRAYVFGRGRFDLPLGFELNVDVEAVTDEAYLLDYGYSDKDRLDSSASVSRTRRNEYVLGSFTDFFTLRPDEIPIKDEQPDSVGRLDYERRVPLGGALGGELRLGGTANSFFRDSTAPDVGRDVGRVGASADWLGSWVVGPGLVAGATFGVAADAYQIDQVSPGAFDEQVQRVTTRAAADLRWPLTRSGPGGGYEILEPMVMVGWAGTEGAEVPNETSTLVEFDEGNLLSLSRFPGEDRIEQGAQAAAGLSWRRFDPAGWSAGVTVGRVMRSGDPDQFTAASGLAGAHSDWLLSADLELDENLQLAHRSILGEGLDVTKSETRLAWEGGPTAIGTTFLTLDASPAENRPDRVQEWAVDAAYAFDRHWTGLVDWRYDFVAEKAARAGVGLAYRNECISVDLSLSRRFTSSASVEPSTDIAVQVSLPGFGGGSVEGVRRACKG